MNLLKFILDTSEKSLAVVIFSVITGISGGMLTVLYSNAILDIFSEEHYLLYLVALPLTSVIFIVSKRISQQKTAVLAERKLEETILKITNTVRHAELAEFEQLDRSEIYTSIVNAQTITRGATRSIDVFQCNITLLVGWLYVFFWLSPLLGLLLIIWNLLYLFVREMFLQIMQSQAGEELGKQTDLFRIFQNCLYGFKELKFNRQKNGDLFANYLSPLTEMIREIRVRSGLLGWELRLFYILGIYLILGSCTFAFSASFPPETVIKSAVLIMSMLQTDMLIHSSISDIIQGNAALERLQGLFDKDTVREADEDVRDSYRNEIREFHSIGIENIRFAYPLAYDEAGFSVSADLMTIHTGEILFITGGNGSGKTTLMNIITGLYPPESGVLRIDGRQVNMAEHRYLFSAIFADSHLFDQIYGLGEIDEDKVVELLRLTGLDRKTGYCRGRFTTSDLSTGQRKRLSLVLAMLEDKPVYVFDEWAADQDPHFRQFFYEKILLSLKQRGKTIIGITHDDRYFHVADQVVRMEYGKIVECLRPDRKKVPAASLFPDKIIQSPSGEALAEPAEARISEKSVKDEYGEQEDKGLFSKTSRIFWENRAPLKRLLRLLISESFILSTLMAVILYAATPQSDYSEARNFSFIILFILFFIMASSQPFRYIVLSAFIFIILHAVSPDMGHSKDTYFLFVVFFIVLLVVISRQLGSQFYNLIEKKIVGLRVKMMNRIRKTDLMTLERTGPGKIYTALTTDIRDIASVSNIILSCLAGGFRIMATFMYMAILYMPAFALMILATAVGGFFYSSNQTAVIRLFAQVRNQERKLFDALGHLLEGFKDLRLSDRKSDDFYHRSLRHHTSLMRDLKIRSEHLYINNYTIAYTLWLGTLLVMTLVMPFAGIPAHLLPIVVGMLIFMPLSHVVDKYSQFYNAYLSALELLDFEAEIAGLAQEPDAETGPEDLSRYDEIRYENIAFVYQTDDDRPFSTGPLSISFRPGETVFVTGGNGSGKSTMLKLITGLYQADSGRFFLNGKETDIFLFRELFSPIFTDFHLFDRLYGMRDIDEAKLDGLLRRFQLEKRVRCSDGKFSTLDLSTGQKKRLAMIITIMEDKPVYIFDEWAADQDPHFREYYYKTLLPEFREQGKTVIAVSHDDRYYHTADRVIRMEYGRIADM